MLGAQDGLNVGKRAGTGGPDRSGGGEQGRGAGEKDELFVSDSYLDSWSPKQWKSLL